MQQNIPRAKKSLGQHFLRHPQISQKIVELLHIKEEDYVLEIGPGPGALTDFLEISPARTLLLVEKDRYWAAERQAKGSKRTQTILIDAMHMPWKQITPHNPWKIVSNLPYNVASPLMWDIFSQATGLARAVFMMQKEVGQRLVAKPNSKAYGALSVWVQSFVRPHWGFVVTPGAFSPPPKVDSAVLSFETLPLELRPRHPNELGKLLKMCFQNRRKQLKSIFRQAKAEHYMTTLDTLHIDAQKRPENLTPQEFMRIVDTNMHTKHSTEIQK